MRFGRVEGIVELVERDDAIVLRLTVYLESGTRLEVLRSDDVQPLGAIDSPADLAWNADQYTQETIGNEMAELGWETIAREEVTPETGEFLPRSASYIVRNLG